MNIQKQIKDEERLVIFNMSVFDVIPNIVELSKNIKILEINSSFCNQEHFSVIENLLFETNVSICRLQVPLCENFYFLNKIYMSNLTKLYLIDVRFCVESMTFLGNGIVESKLETLDISYNNLKDYLFQILCNHFEKTRIRFLTLVSNQLSFVSILSLMKIIHNTKITNIDLFYNRITDLGVEYLFEKLHLSKIRFLDISKNCLTSKSCCIISEKLPYTKLTTLWIYDDDLSILDTNQIINAIPSSFLSNFYCSGQLVNENLFSMLEKNKKKIERFNAKIHFKNFINLICYRERIPQVFLIKDLIHYIEDFL